MLSDEKILITGPAGRIAYPLTRHLARDNEVWGVARFSDPEQRREIDAMGVTTRRIDLASGDFSEIPDDFTYVLHLAVSFDADYDRAIQVNAEGTGLLLSHCRKAKAALVMSTVSVYKPHPDPWHPFAEDDPLGDSITPHTPSYSVSKISEEGVARYCARLFDLPITLARMNSAYGERGGLAGIQLDAMVAGQPVHTRWDPLPYSPIHDDDIAAQVEPLLDAATVPATIVNWGGDEPVTVEEWTSHLGSVVGIEPELIVTPVPGASIGAVADHTKRLSITGPCTVPWRDGMRRMAETLYPERVAG